MTTDNKLRFKDFVIVAGLTLLALAALPLVAVLGFALQFAFVAVFPALLVGTMAYALVTRAEPVVAMIRGIEVPSDVLFWRGHSWARRLAKNCVVVGVDDFAQRLIGRVDSVRIVNVGQKVRAGERLATLGHGARSVEVPAPVGGVVLKVNTLLEREPSAVNSAPYSRGWVAEIEPDYTAWKSLKHGGKAMRWMRREVDRLVMLVQGASVAPSLPDGGELVPDVSASVDDETWNALVDAFFHAE